MIEQAFDELEGELPTGWNAGVSEFTLALTSVDTSEFLAVPEFALALRGEEVLPPLRAPREAIPYEWAGLEGWFRPWLGEKMSVCTVSADDVRLFTSQEPLMARYAGRLGEGRAVDADVFASVDLRALSAIAGVLVARAAEHELLPYWNAEDVEARVLPAIEGSRHLGRLVVRGDVLDDGLHVQAELKPFVVPIPEATTQ